jgi:hypothetical protein
VKEQTDRRGGGLQLTIKYEKGGNNFDVVS